MKTLTIAICTYNRAENLPTLVEALHQQRCSAHLEVLFIDNNSTDATPEVIAKLAREASLPIRYIRETRQGIPFARNRAIEESLHRDYLLFMDDDELPLTEQMAQAAIDAFERHAPLCIGGRIEIQLDVPRPAWLTDELLGFYGKIDYGNEPFQIKDASTPIWSGIVAYDTTLFRNNPDLRFDARYNRTGQGIGGGEDAIMFRELLQRNMSLWYEPRMGVIHLVESWRVSRKYFWKLHFLAGQRQGIYELENYSHTLFGAPLFLYRQATIQASRFFLALVKRDRHYVRKGMNLAHAAGLISGYRKRLGQVAG